MEQWNIYDVNRENTGRIIERCNANLLKDNEYHLCIHICIFNTNNEMLIQKRQITKKDDPGKWDFSVRGSVLMGETSQMGAQREMFEELGIHYDLSNTRPNFTLNTPNVFDDYYILKLDIDINKLKLQECEVECVKWASKKEIITLIEHNIFAKCQKELIEFIYNNLIF